MLFRPQTKLWEGNVFTDVCLSTGVHPSGPHPWAVGVCIWGGGVHPSGLPQAVVKYKELENSYETDRHAR